MKTTYSLRSFIPHMVALFLFMVMIGGQNSFAQTSDHKTYEGHLVNAQTNEDIVYATVIVDGTTIATVSNLEGKFKIKIPKEFENASLNFSSLGYSKQTIALSKFNTGEELKIELRPQRIELSAIKVRPKDARAIIDAVLERRRHNYGVDPLLMTGFYRETIKRRKKYVAVSEAVVEIYKQPFYTSNKDMVRMIKGRKNTDVSKLDTLLFKLQGGPYTALMIDLIKDPYMVLSEEMAQFYHYEYKGLVQEDDQLYYNIAFEQTRDVEKPLYYGNIYIHADDLAIASVQFDLNTENKAEASKMLIRKKPAGTKIYPTRANYMVKYTKQNDQWYFSYSRGGVEFKVNWKKKVFNSKFVTAFELAVTQKEEAKERAFKNRERIKTTAVMEEEISGFIDNDFWGEYNVIKPEEPIDSAIEKIRKNLAELEED